VSLAVVFNVVAVLIFLELGIAGDGDAARAFADAAAYVEDVAVLVAELLRQAIRAIGPAAEQEDLAGPGTANYVLDAVAVQVHKLRTEADASARGHPAALEFHAGLVSGLRLRPASR